MQGLRAGLGYALAALALVIVLATLMGMGQWERALVAATGLRVSPWFTGGDVALTVARGDHRVLVHRPVFQALVGERAEGFVQVDWAPADSLAPVVEDDIDFDGDRSPDFRVRLDTVSGTAEVTPLGADVLGVRGTCRLDDRWAVRVNLRNPRG